MFTSLAVATKLGHQPFTMGARQISEKHVFVASKLFWLQYCICQPLQD